MIKSAAPLPIVFSRDEPEPEPPTLRDTANVAVGVEAAGAEAESSVASGDSGEYVSGSGEAVDDLPTDRASRPSEFLREQAEAFIKDSLTACLIKLGEICADAHGLGPLYRATEFVWRARRWVPVAEGNRGIQADVPIPLGSGVEFDASVHLSDGEEPPLTACLAPSDGSPVGVVAIGDLTISPDSGHHDTGHDWPAEPQAAAAGTTEGTDTQADWPIERTAHVEVVTVDESLPEMLEFGQPQQRVAMLQHLVEDEFQPRLLRQRSLLEEAGVELIVVYGPPMGFAFWLPLRSTDLPSWRVVIQPNATGQLALKVIEQDQQIGGEQGQPFQREARSGGRDGRPAAE